MGTDTYGPWHWAGTLLAPPNPPLCLGGVSSVTSEHGQSVPDESAPPASAPGRRTARWAGCLVVGLYVLASFGLTWRLWADPAGRMVAGNPGDTNLFAWFMRYSATAVSHGRLPALVTTGLNAPHGINLMWNTALLLPGVLLAPVTLLAGPQTSLTILLTAGYAGSAASLFWVLRRWGSGLIPAGLGGAIYGFSPALLATSMGHFHLQFAVLPPLIIDALLRILAGRGRAVLAGLGLGLLIAAQLFTGEELLADTAVAAVVTVVVLILGQPRAAIAAVRTRAWAMLSGFGVAVAAVGLTSGYALWVQFRGPLVSRGSPWVVTEFHNYPYAFVTPSGALLFHTSASAATVAGYPEPLPEYLAYLGWPLLIVLAIAAVCFCWDPKVRLAAVTFAVLELFSLGVVSETVGGWRYPVSVLPWHWLQHLPLLADLLPDRLSILADGAAGAVLAFALDRAYTLGVRVGRPRLIGLLATTVAVLAVLPLIPRPVPVTGVTALPSGWQTAFARLHLAPSDPVLLIPDLRLGMRWQAETGVPRSMVGGGATIEPAANGQATSYVDQRRPTAYYLEGLYLGLPGGNAPSRAQLRADFAYWHPAAIVAVTTRNTRLGRYLTTEFGPPTIIVGDMLAWRRPVLHAPPGKLAPLRREGRACLAWTRSSSRAGPGSSALTFANDCSPTGAR
jgi:hypothetical protein